tara:strand:- start:261 stop:464 length:204 start_codon:yes stop_codon:yes gene_type:complete
MSKLMAPLLCISFVVLIAVSAICTINTASEVSKLKNDLKIANERLSKELKEIKDYAKGLDDVANKWR